MGAGSPEKVHFEKTMQNHQKRIEDDGDSPVKRTSNRTRSKHNNDAAFMCYNKIMTLPLVSAELQRLFTMYNEKKRSNDYFGRSFRITEWILRKAWTFLLFLLFTQPLADKTRYFMSKVKFLDEFLCHQLDFLEWKLNLVDTNILYHPGGIIDRTSLLIQLSLRMLFFLPRISLAMTAECFRFLLEEFMTNVNILYDIIYTKSPRRSMRKKVTKSPSKKRKQEEREEDLSGNLPDYFICMDYHEKSDSDYAPVSDDDTEVTSASEHSQQSDGESEMQEDNDCEESGTKKDTEFEDEPKDHGEISKDIDISSTVQLVTAI